MVLELHYVRGFKGPELAEVLAVPEGTVRSRLRRARAALAQHMSELSEAGLGEGAVEQDLEGWAGRSASRPAGARASASSRSARFLRSPARAASWPARRGEPCSRG